MRSLARPGGNVTGISTQWELFPPKHIEFLREILPGLRRIGVLIDTSTPGAKLGETRIREAAQLLNIALLPYYVRDSEGIDRALSQMEKDLPEALVWTASALVYAHRNRVYERTLRLRIPFAASVTLMADEQALLAYGPSFEQAFRDATNHVARILKGAKPGDLPVEQPTRFELVINLKTAKAIGLKIPQSLLARADRVIE